MNLEEKDRIRHLYDWETNAELQEKLMSLDGTLKNCLICDLVCLKENLARKKIMEEQTDTLITGIQTLIQALDMKYCILAGAEADEKQLKAVAESLHSLCETFTMPMLNRKTSHVDEHLKTAAVKLLKERELIGKKEFTDADNVSVNLVCMGMETLVNTGFRCRGREEDIRLMYLSEDGMEGRFIEVKRNDLVSDLIPENAYRMLLFDGALGKFVFPEEAGSCHISDVCCGNGNGTIYVFGQNNCAVDIAWRVFGSMYRESCGKCALCREGLLQYSYIVSDITRGKGTPEDMETLSDIFMSLKSCGNCAFGKQIAAAILTILQHGSEEFEQHIQRKRCANLRCSGMFSYYVKAEDCQGCGKCLDVCEAKAIDGAEGKIHIIREKSCIKCGNCERICPAKAVQRAGAVKPVVPDTLVPVGSFTSQKRGLMTRRRKK